MPNAEKDLSLKDTQFLPLPGVVYVNKHAVKQPLKRSVPYVMATNLTLK